MNKMKIIGLIAEVAITILLIVLKKTGNQTEETGESCSTTDDM